MSQTNDNFSFFESKKKLSQHFAKASQRTFVSTPIAGALPLNSSSDHLAIEIKDENGKVVIVSANLLADQHIYNTFMPLANKWALQDVLTHEGLNENSYIKKMNMFFYEMAEYARQYQNFGITTTNFTYDDQSFNQFLSSEFFFKTRDPQKAKADRIQIGEWIKGLSSTTKIKGEEFSKQDISLTIAHALQTLHHIEFGGLKYDPEIVNSRLNLFHKSGLPETFDTTLAAGGFVNLQECTNPQLILDRLAGNYKAIIHNTAKDGQSQDNCVIIYNADLFETPDEAKIQKFTLGGALSAKPAIIASFEYKKGGVPIIIGSIHHPGGDHKSELQIILDKVNNVKGEEGLASQIIVAGDFNHIPEFFAQDLLNSGMNTYAPSDSTMGGPDFRGLVKDLTVDFALSNTPVHIEVIKPATYPEPAITSDISITVKFGDAETILARSYNYFPILETSQAASEASKDEWRLILSEEVTSLGDLNYSASDI